MKSLIMGMTLGMFCTAPLWAMSNEDKLESVKDAMEAAGCELKNNDAMNAAQAVSGLSQNDFGMGLMILFQRGEIVDGASGGPRLVVGKCK